MTQDSAAAVSLFTVINTAPPRSASKNGSRKAFLVSWKLNLEKDVIELEINKLRGISNKSVTVFDVR